MPGDHHDAPHLEPASWGRLVDSLDVANIFVVIQNWLGDKLRAEVSVEDIWQETLWLAWRDRSQHEWRNLTAYRAWLLGIAVNLIRRKQSELGRLNWREPLARDLYPGDEPSDDEVFEWLAAFTEVSTMEALESNQAANALLAGVSPEDAYLLRLAILSGLDGDALARELGVTPGAARVRHWGRRGRAANSARRSCSWCPVPSGSGRWGELRAFRLLRRARWHRRKRDHNARA